VAALDIGRLEVQQAILRLANGRAVFVILFANESGKIRTAHPDRKKP
jgi:hypothetical protein